MSMLAALLVSLALVQEGSAPAGDPGDHEDPELHPRVFVSESGQWALDVDPSSPFGNGSATYTLFFRGARVWSREHPFTLSTVVITDEGATFGHSFRPPIPHACFLTYSIWEEAHYHVAALLPNGERVSYPRLRNRQRPERITAEARPDGFAFRLEARPALVREYTADRVKAPAPAADSAPSDLALLQRGREPVVALGFEEHRLELLSSTPLATGRHLLVHVDAAGRILFADRGGEKVEVFDRNGRRVLSHAGSEDWGGRVYDLDVVDQGRILVTTDRGLHFLEFPGAFPFQPAPGTPKGLVSARSRDTGKHLLWQADLLGLRPANPEAKSNAISRAPTGHWLVEPGHGAAGSAKGPLVVLDRRRESEGELSFVHVYDADGAGQRSLLVPALGYHPWTDGRAVAFVEQAGGQALVWIHALDGSRSLRCAVERYGTPAFSPAHILGESELWVVAFDKPTRQYLLDRYVRP